LVGDFISARIGVAGDSVEVVVFAEDFLRELLSLWWRIVQSEPAYVGPYPQRLSNRDY